LYAHPKAITIDELKMKNSKFQIIN
jgi:hypothetical protein